MSLLKISRGEVAETISHHGLLLRIASVLRFLEERGGEEPSDSRHVLVSLPRERGEWQLPCIVACWAWGAVFVPLDPSWPELRKENILANFRYSKANFFVAERGEDVVNAQVNGFTTAFIDEFEAYLEGMNENSRFFHLARTFSLTYLDDWVPISDRAYIFFTSGTSGNPKGVAISHRSMRHLLRCYCGTLSQSVVEETWVGFISGTQFSFDISLVEILLPFFYGKSLALICDGVSMKSGALLHKTFLRVLKELGRRGGKIIFQGTPATFRILRWHSEKHGDVQKVLERMIAFCGGEALPPSEAVFLKASFLKSFNCYGPTETCVWSSILPLKDWDLREEKKVPLGVPFQGERFFIANEETEAGCKVIPLDFFPTQSEGDSRIVGELLIGGEGVAEGYPFDPEQSGNSFVWILAESSGDLRVVGDWAQGSERVYRTGDLVSFCPARGTLDFEGRRDEQIKLRGLRIELGEIEEGCRRVGSFPEGVQAFYDSIEEIIVIFVRNETLESNHECRVEGPMFMDSEKDLQGCLVSAPFFKSLKQDLKRLLPFYMLPRRVIRISKFPLTSHGKTDRAVLQKISSFFRESLSENEKIRGEHQKRGLEMQREERKPGARPADIKPWNFLDFQQNIERKILEILVLEIEVEGEVNDSELLNCSFDSLGVDSMSVMQLVGRIDKVIKRAAFINVASGGRKKTLGTCVNIISGAHIVEIEDIFAHRNIRSFCHSLHQKIRSLPPDDFKMDCTNTLKNQDDGTLPAVIQSKGSKSPADAAPFLKFYKDGNCDLFGMSKDEKLDLLKTLSWPESFNESELSEYISQRIKDSSYLGLLSEIGGEGSGSAPVIESLFLNGLLKSSEQKDKFGSSLLHYAGGSGDLETCKILMGLGEIPDIHLLFEGKGENVRVLAREIVGKFGYECTRSPFFKDKKSGRNLLHWASRKGQLPVCQAALSLGLSVDSECRDGTSPIHLAAWGGFPEVIRLLIANGADLKKENRWNCHAAHFAALNGKVETMLSLLVLARQRFSQDLDGSDPIPSSLDAVKFYSENLEPTLPPLGETCSSFPSRSELVELSASLLKSPVFWVFSRNGQGHSAFHKAAYGGHWDLCRWIVKEGIGMWGKGSDSEVQVALLRFCMLPDIRGQTPSDLARKGGHDELSSWICGLEKDYLNCSRGGSNPSC